MEGVGVAAEVAPTAGSSRFRADIQGLRALAVIAVVAYHSGVGFSGGFVGVDVFFVVSGYVITRMLRAEKEDTGRVDLGRFYLRRIRRILPASAALIVFVVATAPMLGQSIGEQVTTRTAAAGSLFMSNLYLIQASNGYFDAGAEANPLLHLWSLSVEEQFYLGFPLLLIAAWRLTRRRPAVLLALAATASLMMSWALTYDVLPLDTHLAHRAAFFASPPRAWEFIAGALLAVASPRLSHRAASASGAAGLALVAYSVFVFDNATLFPGSAAIVPVVGTCLLVAADRPTRLSALLSSGPAQWIGNLSYSWYLWHWPMIVFGHALAPGSGWVGPAAGLLSLGPAWLSQRYIENPIRHRPMPAWRTVALGAACVLVPVATLVGLLPLRTWTASRLETAQPEIQRAATLAGGCKGQPECISDVADSVGRAVLIGDSNAGHLSEGFFDAAARLGLDAEVRTQSACPFADLTIRDAGVIDAVCRRIYEEQLEALISEKPDLVVVANASDRYIDRESFALSRSAGGPWATKPTDRAGVVRDALTSTLTVLRKTSIPVVMVHPVPKFLPEQDPRVCAVVRLLIDEASCGAEDPTADLLERRRLALHAEEQAIVDGVVPLDPAPVLCPESMCSTRRDGTWWWLDNLHISIAGSRALAGQMEKTMASALRGG